jgi:hypothetical protein
MIVAGISSTTVIDNVLIYAIATSVGALLIWIGKSVATVAKNQSAIHDQVMGVPEVGYPSMRDQFTEIRNHLCRQDQILEKQDSTLANLEHEVQDNSGSSLKDAVKVVNRDVNNIRKEILPGLSKNNETLQSLQKKVDEIDARLEKHLNSINSKNN